jgi:glycosyltransferase involved in cell wall biosynthesis
MKGINNSVRSKHIGLLAHYLGPRLGIGHYIERLLPPLVRELEARGIQVTIFASPNAFERTPAIQQLNDRVRVLPPLDYSPYKRYLWVGTSFYRYCLREQIAALAWLSNPMALPWHPPSLAVIHDVNEWKINTKGRWRTVLRSLIYLDGSINFANKIIAISKATENDLYYFRPHLKQQNKLRYIPQGVDSQLVILPPVEIPKPDAPFLLYVGRIDPAAKRLPATVALASALREIDDRPWELHLIGGMNESTQVAGEAFLRSIQDKPWIHYQGYVDDEALAQWYRNCNAVVFLSDLEGFGFPIAEAASFGRWAIVSNLNLAGVEAGGEAIIEIDPERPESAAAKILQQLQQSPYPKTEQTWQQWKDSAIAYADEIDNLFLTRK